MKKIFLVLGLIFSTTISAITHTVVNAAPFVVQVQLDLRFTPDEYIILQPGEFKEVYVGAAPLRMVKVTAVDGKYAGEDAHKNISYARPWGRTIIVGIKNNKLAIR